VSERRGVVVGASLGWCGLGWVTGEWGDGVVGGRKSCGGWDLVLIVGVIDTFMVSVMATVRRRMRSRPRGRVGVGFEVAAEGFRCGVRYSGQCAQSWWRWWWGCR